MNVSSVEASSLKIVQLITRMDVIAGAQNHVRDISIALQHEGHQVIVVTGGNSSRYPDVLDEGISVNYIAELLRDINLLLDIKAFLKMRRLFKKLQPDIIAIHSSKAGIIGRLVAFSLRIPVVFTAHGWSFTDGVQLSKRVIYRWIERIAAIVSDGVITVSDYDMQLALTYKVVSMKKITTIHNGVHDIDRNLYCKQTVGVPKIIMVARFAPPKKQLELLHVLMQLQQYEWTMHFIGDGPELEEARKLVDSVNIHSCVHFEGASENVCLHLSNAHIFILLSDYEGLPLSILEAMRAGLPVIASNVGGVKEAVTAENGFLVETTDTESIKKSIVQLISDKKMRMSMGHNSRQLYEEHFTFQRMLTETRDFYQKIIEKRKHG